MKMDKIELKKIELLQAQKCKELLAANRTAANEMLLRMLSSLNPEVSEISVGEDLYE